MGFIKNFSVLKENPPVNILRKRIEEESNVSYSRKDTPFTISSGWVKHLLSYLSLEEKFVVRYSVPPYLIIRPNVCFLIVIFLPHFVCILYALSKVTYNNVHTTFIFALNWLLLVFTSCFGFKHYYISWVKSSNWYDNYLLKCFYLSA